MQEVPVECTHEPCNCSVAASLDGDDPYCSDFCRTADEGELQSDTCACGHPACDTP
ncbi:MAG: hypothetical protein JO078_01290 [Candidatus Eremiobacteraeota bacterium]|nr:hypothetical protein [Candidatus Eremiobacteraeota bacterium]MBV9057213.1 hypothetical protein [Candidatus Eremiobacteraeota bacterium]MBV9698735.1 hypothetical protein [Candidatus Eremiobacteraeota bacterium]